MSKWTPDDLFKNGESGEHFDGRHTYYYPLSWRAKLLQWFRKRYDV